jgi:DNA polymerase alpha subunit A
MYGCLGFSHSRFYAQPIAALITAMGRDILQRSVTIAQDTVGLDVIYGDTDSIMINTRISGKDLDQLKNVYELGARVKHEVNRLYRTLELEIDGVFQSMLLLKKKKYAATTVSTSSDGQNTFGKETKGLDQVRRDWCKQSKDTGRYVLDQILSGQDREETVSKIHSHLEEIASKMRSNELPLEAYVITKGLSKHPDQYPDGKSLPHVQVAKMMLKAKRPVNTGDHIPYVITQELEVETQKPEGKKKSAAERARHPEEIQRSNGVLKPDIEWYLSQQILPPISRLCENIDGTSQAMIASKLGLDASRFNHNYRAGDDIDDNRLCEYKPASLKTDSERFQDVEKFVITCQSCNTTNELKGVFTVGDRDAGQIISCYNCPNYDCNNPIHWGYNSHFDLLSVLSNKLTVAVRQAVGNHGTYECQCEDASCGMKTRQMSVSGNSCLRRGCAGITKPIVSAMKLDLQIKYLKSLFDINHCYKQYVRSCHSESEAVQIQDVKRTVSLEDQLLAEALCEKLNVTLRKSAYNTVEPDLFLKLFAV